MSIDPSESMSRPVFEGSERDTETPRERALDSGGGFNRFMIDAVITKDEGAVTRDQLPLDFPEPVKPPQPKPRGKIKRGRYPRLPGDHAVMVSSELRQSGEVLQDPIPPTRSADRINAVNVARAARNRATAKEEARLGTATRTWAARFTPLEPLPQETTDGTH